MYWIIRARWPGHLLALIAGALTPLSMAPFHLWPLALISLGLFYYGLQRVTPSTSLVRGWCYGLGVFGAGTSWIYVSIHVYGNASPLLAGALTLLFCATVALFFAGFAWVWRRWLYSQYRLLNVLSFAALWVLQESLRGWFLSGFPWLYLGYSQLAGPLSGLAPIGGVWLISFVLVLSSTALVHMLLPLAVRQRLALVIGLVVVWSVSWSLQNQHWTSPAGTALSVAAIQGNVRQEMKWDPAALSAQLLLYREFTATATRTDLVVWPETAVPVLEDQAQDYLTNIQQFVTQQKSALITGIPVRHIDADGHKRYYNAIRVLGQGTGTYLKQKLVPFGEYVPLQEILRGLIEFFDLPMSDFYPGPTAQPLLSAQGYQIAPAICYEVVYPNFVATQARNSNLLLTVSNDAWFGHSIGPLQHLQMAQMRALETGRWMIRATNTGVTALINPQGHMQESLPQFKPGVLYGSIIPMQGSTPFMRWQNFPLLTLSLLIILGVLDIRRYTVKANQTTY